MRAAESSTGRQVCKLASGLKRNYMQQKMASSLSPITRRLSFELLDLQEGLKSLSWTPSYNNSRKTPGSVPLLDTWTTTTTMSRINGLSRDGGDNRKSTEYFRARRRGSEAIENHHKSVEMYLDKLHKQDAKPDEFSPSSTGRNLTGMTEDSAVEHIRRKKSNFFARKSKASQLSDEKDSASLHFISILLSMDIAVFLFEIASPIKNADHNLYSLPLMYGAKVNDLIMDGEWWRLVTPMFLHAGLLHVALSSWMLLSFGPQVCKGYGAFTFFLIYLLGGISGNFSSFLHTSEPTVGGSGPVFAVIGAWLIYQVQNKDISAKENVDGLFQKAISATAVSFVLANFGPIDNWTSLGGAVSGIIYGYLTCPVVQVDDTSETCLKEGITLSRQQPATPCKSLLLFTLFLTLFTSFLFIAESPLQLEELVQIVE